MILERGNMWDVFGNTDLFLVTTNPIVRKDGACVMGRGIAKEAATKFPQLPFDLGKEINRMLEHGSWTSSWALEPGLYDGQKMGWFMVKEHWREEAVLSIIKESVECLQIMLEQMPHLRIDLNFPGIGNGKLRREDVLPIISILPDNVHVWEYEPETVYDRLYREGWMGSHGGA